MCDDEAKPAIVITFLMDISGLVENTRLLVDHLSGCEECKRKVSVYGCAEMQRLRGMV